jgi:hypothetical protein
VPDYVSLSTTVVTASAGHFTATTRGGCIEAGTITVRDSAGRTAVVTITNARGSQSVPTLAVSPNEATLTDCTSSVNVNVFGGSGRYSATSGNPAVMAILNGNILTVRRAPSTTFSGDVPVGVSDGQGTVTLTVHITANSASCP